MSLRPNLEISPEKEKAEIEERARKRAEAKATLEKGDREKQIIEDLVAQVTEKQESR